VIVVLDSSVICADFRMEGDSFRMFFEGVERDLFTISIPETVIKEVVNEFKERIQTDLRDLDKTISHLERLTKNSVVFPKEGLNLDKSVQDYEAFLKKKFTDNRATFLNYDTSSHKRILNRVLSRKKPFSKSGSGYGDNLIWECVLDAAKSCKDQIILITLNSKDFAGEKGKLHDDLRSDLLSFGIVESRVKLSLGIDQFVKRYIMPKDSQVRRELEKLDIKEWLEKNLEEQLTEEEWSTDDMGLNPNFEHVMVSELQEITSIEFDSIAYEDLHNVYVSINVYMTVSLGFSIRNPDYAALKQDNNVDYEIPREWDLFIDYPFGSMITTVMAGVLLFFNLDTKQIKEVEVRGLFKPIK